MLNHTGYKYGSKLEFIHTKNAFRQEDLALLEYILKYAEIIKYSNETVGSYGKYMRTMSNEYITISNTGLDEIFDVLKNRKVLFKRNVADLEILFEDKNPDIEFIVNHENEDFAIIPNIDVFSYDVLQGYEYAYVLTKNSLYRCDKNFENTVLKLLEIYRENYTNKIKFKRNEFANFCSIVYPKLKSYISLENLDKDLVKTYVPEDLYIKIYLDYDENNYITADIKFVYGEKEFNPLKETNISVARDAIKENEYMDIFVNTGFMLDTKNSRLILTDEEKIYNFLTEQIEMYMKKFEVLVTDNFKKREIRRPKIESIGIKIENNLLQVDFTKLDFSLEEIQGIMQKYVLRKKFHRLKDGSFLNLEENDTLNFISSLLKDEEITYKDLERGEIKLPVSRSMYLDRILQKIDANISKDDNYKKIVKQISKKEIEEDIRLPKGLKSELRNYQVTGFKWLKILDEYQFGGILADDMGLGKTIQVLAQVHCH